MGIRVSTTFQLKPDLFSRMQEHLNVAVWNSMQDVYGKAKLQTVYYEYLDLAGKPYQLRFERSQNIELALFAEMHLASK